MTEQTPAPPAPSGPDEGGDETEREISTASTDEPARGTRSASGDEAGTGYEDHDKTIADSFPASDPPSY